VTATPGALPDRLLPALKVFSRHASPRVLTALVAVALAVRVALGNWSLWDLAVVGGLIAFWPLQEWLIHVFILHYQPVKLFGRELDFKVPKLHRAHHRDPWRLDLIFIPIHVFAYTPITVGALVLLGLPQPQLVATGLAAYYALSLHYEWAHFMIHTHYRPRLGYYQRLAKNHLLHHFRNEHYWYGVSMLQADRWLRTAPDPSEVPKSPTAMTLAAQAGG
jgi:Fatty acid hydroxylase superfamily